MIILGINAYHADSSAAIFRDGVMIAATEEERFRRTKHWAGFPSEAIRFCLKEAGIEMKELDYIAIGRDPKAKLYQKMKFLAKNPAIGFSAVKERIRNSIQVSSLENEFVKLDASLTKEEYKSKVQQVEHHRSHLASAFYASPFSEAALLSIDGSGDFSTTMRGIGRGHDMEIIDSVNFPHSVGIFYSAFTQLLGFPHYGDEYKVMGLAPYGQAKYVEKLRDVLVFKDDGLFSLNEDFFRIREGGIVKYDENNVPVVATLYSPKMEDAFGSCRKKGAELSQYHIDLAASVQRITEELIFHILTGLHKRTGMDRVCIAGGVAQNSVANGKITRNTPFKEVYIPSAGHDAGISMGAAQYVYHQVLKNERKPAVWSAYTGVKFGNEEIAEFLKSRDVSYKELDDDALYDYVADKLINGAVVGWFTGRAEFGPRALGGRSIIADPRRADAKELLNAKIKRRESFRPFAPSILEDFVDEYFELNAPVPFMEKVYPIRPEKRSVIPAVTHVDGTGRLQSVIKSVAPRYYALIERFYQKTGVPILLNTSFNENEPIVNNPGHALDCFLRTNMDLLVLENFVIERG